MSISEGENRESFFAWSSSSKGARASLLALMLIVVGGFVLTSSITTTMPMTTTVFAQEGNNNTTTGAATTSDSTTNTIDGDADSDTDGSVHGAAGGGGNENTTTSTNATFASSSSSGIELSPQPVYQEQEKLVSQIPINQTHFEVIATGNGTLALPDDTETIRTTSTKSGIVSMMDGTFAGKEILTTEDGSENATATIYEIVRFNMESGNGTGIAMALFHTNSSQLLAPFDGMILSGHDELQANGTGLLTLWEWQSGIPYVKMQQPPLMMQESPTNSTTTTTKTSDLSPPPTNTP